MINKIIKKSIFICLLPLVIVLIILGIFFVFLKSNKTSSDKYDNETTSIAIDQITGDEKTITPNSTDFSEVLNSIDLESLTPKQLEYFRVIVNSFEKLDSLSTIKYEANGGDEYSSDEEVVENLTTGERKTIYRNGKSPWQYGEEEYPIIYHELINGTYINCEEYGKRMSTHGLFYLRDVFMLEFNDLGDDSPYSYKELVSENVSIDKRDAIKYTFTFKVHDGENALNESLFRFIKTVKAEIGPTDHSSHVIIDEDGNIVELYVSGGYFGRKIKILDRNIDAEIKLDCDREEQNGDNKKSILTGSWEILKDNFMLPSVNGFVTINKSTNAVVVKDFFGKTLSSYDLPKECATVVQNFSTTLYNNRDNFSRIYCNDGNTYFFNSEQVILKTNLLSEGSRSLLSKDLKYLAYNNRENNSSEMNLINLSTNEVTTFELKDELDGGVLVKLLPTVSADCGHYGPFPFAFDSNTKNLYVETVCVDGYGELNRIDLANNSVSDIRVGNTSLLKISDDNSEHFYSYSFEDPPTVLMKNKIDGSIIKLIPLPENIIYLSPPGGNPFVDITNDGKYAIFNSFVDKAMLSTYPELKEIHTLSFFDLKTNTVVGKIDEPIDYMKYIYITSVDSKIIYASYRYGEHPVIYSYDTSTGNKSLIYALSEEEVLLKL